MAEKMGYQRKQGAPKRKTAKKNEFQKDSAFRDSPKGGKFPFRDRVQKNHEKSRRHGAKGQKYGISGNQRAAGSRCSYDGL